MTLPGWFIWLMSAAILIAILVVGRPFLIPVAIALLLFSLISALIERITQISVMGWRIPRFLAATLGMIIVTAALYGIFTIIARQVNEVIVAAPRYMQRIEELVVGASDLLGRNVGEELRLALQEIDIAGRLPGIVGSTGGILTTIILIIIYMAFMFSEQGAFRSKFPRLFPHPDRERRAQAIIDSISANVQRYFSIKLLTSGLTGLAAYAIMKPMGLDFAETWALLAVMLNFIPNVGSVIATILPALIALVQFDSYVPFLIIALGVTAVQMTIGNIIEPALMGRSLNLSPLVIIISLTFWASVWGVVGMFLAVPIMVMVLIVCSQIEPLRPLAVLLSRDGILPQTPVQPDRLPAAKKTPHAAQ